MVKEINDSGYILSPEERSNHFKVYAGPGAGKTHFLVNNIKNIIENDQIISASEKRKVLCITYTNATANELKTRLSRYLDRVVVSTIHSFIGEYIIKPFQPLLRSIIKKDFGMDIDPKTILHSQIEGRGLLVGHHRTEVYDYINKLVGEAKEISYSRSAIESVELSIDSFETKASSKINRSHIEPIKAFLWSEAGILSHDEVLIFGLKLANRYSLLQYILRVQFPYVFIDEFQDTNPIQTKLLQLICAKASIAGVIGDVAQSIYSFQGAKPDDFLNFFIPTDTKRQINEFVLKTNRRSKDNIVKMINYMRQKDTNLSNQLTLNSTEDNDKVKFFVERTNLKTLKETPQQVLQFIENGAYVLTRTWAQTFQYIQGIDSRQSKIINDLNNLYTYRIKRDLRKTVAEFRDVPWIQALIFITSLENALENNCIPSAVRTCEKLELINKKDVFSRPGLLLQFINYWKEIVCGIDDQASLIDNFKTINRLMSTHNVFWNQKYLVDEKDLLPDDPSDIDSKIFGLLSNLQYKAGKKLVNEVFLDDSRYMTVHKAKGREFEKVLVYLEPAKPDGEVSYIEMLKHPNVTQENEYDRIMYVAMSRAISELGIHIKIGTKDDFSAVISSIEEWCEIKGIKNRPYEVIDV